HRLAHPPGQRIAVVRLAGILRMQRAQKLARTRQAAAMGGEDALRAAVHGQSARLAMRAPSTRLASFAETISGSISGRWPGTMVEAKPQSVPAITRSRPTILA